MKQKIVIKIEMHSGKCITKALTKAASVAGVNSVAIEGDEKNLVVVIGEGIDSVKLTKLLRKKVGYASIVSVNEEKPKKEEEKPKIEEWKVQNPTPWTYGYHYQYPPYQTYGVVYDRSSGGCSMM